MKPASQASGALAWRQKGCPDPNWAAFGKSVLELVQRGGMYEYDLCRCYRSPSKKSTDLDNARRCENEISGGCLQASFPHHPKRGVSYHPPQSRAFLPRDTSDPSYQWCACAGLKIDACACL